MPWLEQLAAVAFVLCLLYAAVWAMARRRGVNLGPCLSAGWNLRRPRQARLLAVLERTSLTPQHSLHLVRVGDRTLLLATHPGGVTFDAAPVAFSQALQNAIREIPGDRQ